MSGTNEIVLSVVIIGRNEEKSLPALFASLPESREVEWIYVDSASSDRSVAIASEAGAKVLRIEQDSVYGPGTGRYVGTLEAKGNYIFYLDGDMVLCHEFLLFIEQLTGLKNYALADETDAYLKRSKKSWPKTAAAFTGRTINVYRDYSGKIITRKDYVVLSKAEMGPPESLGKKAFYHGGAVCYKKSAVIEAGNWNPALLQLEEFDLLCRVIKNGGELMAVDLAMVEHNAIAASLKEKLAQNFLPRFGEKQLYGAGQALAAALKEKRLLQFIALYPYPFLVLLGLIAALPLLICAPLAAILLNLLIAFYIGVKKKWYYYLVYLGNLGQMARGIFKYKPFTPVYTIQKSSGGGQTV